MVYVKLFFEKEIKRAISKSDFIFKVFEKYNENKADNIGINDFLSMV